MNKVIEYNSGTQSTGLFTFKEAHQILLEAYDQKKIYKYHTDDSNEKLDPDSICEIRNMYGSHAHTKVEIPNIPQIPPAIQALTNIETTMNQFEKIH